ncbi:MAG: hypothetical protein QOK47_584 [Actinomycetota bacterium]|jgi:hypothetical protein|nr:hypothetical protein [Actinomycetota bacterium]
MVKVKRALAVTLVVGLIFGGIIGTAEAKKKKKPKVSAPVQVDQKYFMRRDDCGNGDADNTRLSTEDGTDSACWFTDAGVAYEVLWQANNEAGEVLWQQFPAENGVPLVLDATKAIGGEITLYGGDCVIDPACSPAGITAGQATFRVRAVATIAGEDKILGVFEDTFTAVPGSTHTSKVVIEIDDALNNAAVEGFRIDVFHGGEAYGPGGIEYDAPASFITVPTYAAAS